jgi:hypothetical protein
MYVYSSEKNSIFLNHGREVPYTIRAVHPSARSGPNLGALAIIMNFCTLGTGRSFKFIIKVGYDFKIILATPLIS